MADRNTVTVRIYGQEYSISGEMPREYIMKLADYVDTQMNEIGAGTSIPMSAVAVLSAVNISDELFQKSSQLETYKASCEQYEKEAVRYEALWEDAKKSIAQTRETQVDTNALFTELNDLRKQNEQLKGRVVELNEALAAAADAPNDANETIRNLELKCRDLESSFYDIQWEKIQLEAELNNLKKQIR